MKLLCQRILVINLKISLKSVANKGDVDVAESNLVMGKMSTYVLLFYTVA